MKEKLAGITWRLGVRTFRLSRKANLSVRLEPVFWRLANLVPMTTTETAATIDFGITLWMPPGYRDTRTVVAGLFQRDETLLVNRITEPGMTVVDVGAYVGYFSMLWSHLVGSSGKVYAFEPETTAYRYLLKNIATNQCSNVAPINKAASDSSAPATLIRDPLGPESYLASSQVGDQGVAIESIALDELAMKEGWPSIDLVKMNIEGSELLALSGMKEVSRRNPGLQLVMEFNVAAMVRAAVTREALSKTLEELGFKRARIVERGMQDLPRGELLPKGRAVYNLLLSK